MSTVNTSVCCVALTSIEGTDCIGDSRIIINTNFTNVGSAICTLSSASTTLNSNTAYLSANIHTLTTAVSTLSTSFSITNRGSLATLGTLVSALSVYNAQGTYIGYLPIYL